jgi:hypothetical protein
MNIADFYEPAAGSYLAQLEEQARRKGVLPIEAVDELRADVFESDEELDDFLVDLHIFRSANLA